MFETIWGWCGRKVGLKRASVGLKCVSVRLFSSTGGLSRHPKQFQHYSAAS